MEYDLEDHKNKNAIVIKAVDVYFVVLVCIERVDASV